MLSAKTSVPFLNKKLASPESVTRVHTNYKPSFLCNFANDGPALGSFVFLSVLSHFSLCPIQVVYWRKKKLHHLDFNVHISFQNMLLVICTFYF